jgi:hypothetical protein
LSAEHVTSSAHMYMASTYIGMAMAIAMVMGMDMAES